jgi:hypothetical protein
MVHQAHGRLRVDSESSHLMIWSDVALCKYHYILKGGFGAVLLTWSDKKTHPGQKGEVTVFFGLGLTQCDGRAGFIYLSKQTMRSEHHDERCIPLSPVIPKSLVTCSKDRSARFRRRTDACTPSDAKAQIAASQGFAYSLHHEVRQSSSLIRHRANIRMRLRFELNVLLRAFCINADLTDRQISRRSMYNKPRNVQKLPCCLPDQRSLGPRIPESESARSIGHEMATGIPLYISRYVQRRTHLDVKKMN